MNLEELEAVLKGFGIRLAYQGYPEESYPEPPYLIFLDIEGQDLKADNKTYFRRRPVRVELYTDTKDPILEKRFEDYLDENELPYGFEGSVYIRSERLNMAAWTVTIMY